MSRRREDDYDENADEVGDEQYSDEGEYEDEKKAPPPLKKVKGKRIKPIEDDDYESEEEEEIYDEEYSDNDEVDEEEYEEDETYDEEREYITKRIKELEALIRQ